MKLHHFYSVTGIVQQLAESQHFLIANLSQIKSCISFLTAKNILCITVCGQNKPNLFLANKHCEDTSSSLQIAKMSK
jgi:hypothetical protein